jgi:hypothetical protein
MSFKRKKKDNFSDHFLGSKVIANYFIKNLIFATTKNKKGYKDVVNTIYDFISNQLRTSIAHAKGVLN